MSNLEVASKNESGLTLLSGKSNPDPTKPDQVLFRPEPNQKYLYEIQRKVKAYAFPKYRLHQTEFEIQETVSAFLVVD